MNKFKLMLAAGLLLLAGADVEAASKKRKIAVVETEAPGDVAKGAKKAKADGKDAKRAVASEEAKKPKNSIDIVVCTGLSLIPSEVKKFENEVSQYARNKFTLTLSPQEKIIDVKRRIADLLILGEDCSGLSWQDRNKYYMAEIENEIAGLLGNVPPHSAEVMDTLEKATRQGRKKAGQTYYPVEEQRLVLAGNHVGSTPEGTESVQFDDNKTVGYYMKHHAFKAGDYLCLIWRNPDLEWVKAWNERVMERGDLYGPLEKAGLIKYDWKTYEWVFIKSKKEIKDFWAANKQS